MINRRDHYSAEAGNGSSECSCSTCQICVLKIRMRKPTSLRSLDARTSVVAVMLDATEMEIKQITLEMKLLLHRTRK